jgi:uncharacterized membrane protein YccC
MRFALHWNWPHDNALQYCLKVSLATLLGYLLSFGNASHAVYGAFTAALVVGSNRGEDVGGAANRVRGSLAGMLVGNALPHLGIPPALSVALGIGATAYVCMGWGWGVAAARIGASLCAVTVLMHANDALSYTLTRAANTLIGIAAGLLVSYLVLPVRGRDAMARGARRTLDAVADLLAAVSQPDRLPTEKQYKAVLDGLIEIEKVQLDVRKEIGGEIDAVHRTVHQLALACLGSLTAALAVAEMHSGRGVAEEADLLCGEAAALAERARDIARHIGGPDGILDPRQPEPVLRGSADGTHEEVRAFALGLRKVEHALASWPAGGRTQ